MKAENESVNCICKDLGIKGNGPKGQKTNGSSSNLFVGILTCMCLFGKILPLSNIYIDLIVSAFSLTLYFSIHSYSVTFGWPFIKQAGTELCQAQLPTWDFVEL